MTKLKQNQFYCVSCRARRTAKTEDICVKIYKNRISPTGESPALRSECPSCGTNLTKFIKHDSVDAAINKFGLC